MKVAAYRALSLGIIVAAAACASSRTAPSSVNAPSAGTPSQLLHAPEDPPPPPTDGVRSWMLLAAGGMGAFGPWRENATEDLPAGTSVGVASMRCTLVTRLASEVTRVPQPVAANGFPDMIRTAQCAPSAMPDNAFTRRLRACFQVHAEPPAKDALASMKASLEADGGENALPAVTPGPRQLVMATIARTWPEPERVRVVHVGCEHVDHPCDPVRIESYAEGKWLVKTSEAWTAAGPGGSHFGGSFSEAIFPMILAAPDTFLVAYDRATHQAHPAFAVPPAVGRDGGAPEDEARRVATTQLRALRAETTHDPDLEAAFLLDRVQLAYRLADLEAARKDEALLRAAIAAQPPKDPALRRALDRALVVLDGIASGKYAVTDPCASKR